jgi:hypothetical protein
MLIDNLEIVNINRNPHMKKKPKKRPFPKKMTRQYRWQLLRKGAGRCPICGGKPDKRAAKSRLCPKHLKAQRLRMRVRLGIKRPFLSPAEQADLDWSLGYALIASMTGRGVDTVKRWFAKLVLSGKVKPGDCPDHSKIAASMHRKRKALEVLDLV